jgi:hypothetical protein
MCTTTPSPQVGYFKRKTAVLMYKNGKMRPVGMILRRGKG